MYKSHGSICIIVSVSLNHLWEKCQIPILQLCEFMDYGSRNILSFAPVYHIVLLSIIHFLKTTLKMIGISKTPIIDFEPTFCN